MKKVKVPKLNTSLPKRGQRAMKAKQLQSDFKAEEVTASARIRIARTSIGAFSDFIRNATDAERKAVYDQVMLRASQRQRSALEEGMMQMNAFKPHGINVRPAQYQMLTNLDQDPTWDTPQEKA